MLSCGMQRYPAARVSSFKPGQVRSGRLAGREWVLYRAADGGFHAADAFCPHMGAHLKSARVLTSDFKRTRETASFIAESLELPRGSVTLDHRLRERDFGPLDLTSDACYPEVWAYDARRVVYAGVESLSPRSFIVIFSNLIARSGNEKLISE